jgi:hypothetical protein
MRWRTPGHERGEEAAIRCLAHGIAHGRAELGDRRLATILGMIALDLAAPGGTTTAGKSRPSGLDLQSG